MGMNKDGKFKNDRDHFDVLPCEYLSFAGHQITPRKSVACLNLFVYQDCGYTHLYEGTPLLRILVPNEPFATEINLSEIISIALLIRRLKTNTCPTEHPRLNVEQFRLPREGQKQDTLCFPTTCKLCVIFKC